MWLGVAKLRSQKRERGADSSVGADAEILEWRLRENSKGQGHLSKLVGINGQVRRCLVSGLRDSSLRSAVGEPA